MRASYACNSFKWLSVRNTIAVVSDYVSDHLVLHHSYTHVLAPEEGCVLLESNTFQVFLEAVLMIDAATLWAVRKGAVQSIQFV